MFIEDLLARIKERKLEQYDLNKGDDIETGDEVLGELPDELKALHSIFMFELDKHKESLSQSLSAGEVDATWEQAHQYDCVKTLRDLFFFEVWRFFRIHATNVKICKGGKVVIRPVKLPSQPFDKPELLH